MSTATLKDGRRPTRTAPSGSELLVDWVCDSGDVQHGMQDACFVKQLDLNCVVAVVADGVTSARMSGEAAKQIATRIGEALVALAPAWSEEAIRMEIVRQNAALLSARPAGQWQTTVAGLVLSPAGGFAFSCGDSWIGLLTDSAEIQLLTPSHGLAAILRRRGGGPIGSRLRGGAELMSCLGSPDSDVAVTPVSQRPGGRFVVATDGLDVLQPREIAATTDRAAPGRVARSLFAAARARGLTDNTTIVGVTIPPHRRARDPRRSAVWAVRLDWLAVLLGLAVLGALLWGDLSPAAWPNPSAPSEPHVRTPADTALPQSPSLTGPPTILPVP